MNSPGCFLEVEKVRPQLFFNPKLFLAPSFPLTVFFVYVQKETSSKVERGNISAFTKLLELDPEADSEEALFTTES